MARRRYYRRAIRVVPKKKWASNFLQFVVSTGSVQDNYHVLCENKSQTSAPTPTIIKTGNFKVQGDLTLNNTSTNPQVGYTRAYILFVPEGWNTSSYNQIPTAHPEWIMAWTTLDLPVASTQGQSGGNKFSISSRLKRNLNSGDKIVFYVENINSPPTVYVNAAAQFWTCAN